MQPITDQRIKAMTRDEFDFHLYASAIAKGIPSFENADLAECDFVALEIWQMQLRNQINIMEKLNREINNRIRQMKEEAQND